MAITHKHHMTVSNSYYVYSQFGPPIWFHSTPSQHLQLGLSLTSTTWRWATVITHTRSVGLLSVSTPQCQHLQLGLLLTSTTWRWVTVITHTRSVGLISVSTPHWANTSSYGYHTQAPHDGEQQLLRILAVWASYLFPLYTEPTPPARTIKHRHHMTASNSYNAYSQCGPPICFHSTPSQHLQLWLSLTSTTWRWVTVTTYTRSVGLLSDSTPHRAKTSS